MSLQKRKIESLSEFDDQEFNVIKKASLISTETCDSSSKDDPNMSPIAFKPHFSEHMQPSEHPETPSHSKSGHFKTGGSGKKKNRSGELSSYEELRQTYMSDPSLYIDNFKVVKYRNYKYKLNTCMLVRNEADADNDFVCKLIRIIKPKKMDENRILAFLEVQWYYRKEDLPKKYVPYFPHLGANEVFLSTHVDFIMVDCINGPCQVLTYDEYDKVETYSTSILYTRASYDVTKKKMEPPIEKWPKVCSCHNPQNPDQVYIQCDSCNSWFHLHCVGLSVEEANSIDKYFCKVCRDPQSAQEHRGKPGRKKSVHKQSRKNSLVSISHEPIISIPCIDPTETLLLSSKPSIEVNEHNDAIDSQETLSSTKHIEGLQAEFEGAMKMGSSPQLESQNYLTKEGADQGFVKMDLELDREASESLFQGFEDQTFASAFDNIQNNLSGGFYEANEAVSSFKAEFHGDFNKILS